MNGGSRTSFWKVSGLVAVVTATALLAGGYAHAGPTEGVYESEEFGGDIMDARWTEGYVNDAQGASGDPDNTIHVKSWDGATLGTQWEIYDLAADSEGAQLVSTESLGGLTILKYETRYESGSGVLLLKKPARDANTSEWWGDGDASAPYEVKIDNCLFSTQVTLVGGKEEGHYTLITLTGSFEDYPECEVQFMLAVAVKLGEGATEPADYPEFLPETADYGQWGIAQKIRMEITPEPATLGLLAMGGMYVLAKARRRRRRRA